MNDILTRPRLTTKVPSLSPTVRTWQYLVVSSKNVAEEILDWAEYQGFHERQFVVLNPSEFVVMWR